MKNQNSKKIKVTIIILSILLTISVTALGGTLLYSYFVHTEPTTVEVPGNIITPEGESTDTTSDTTPSTSDNSDTSPDTPSTDKPSNNTSSEDNTTTPDRTDTPNTSGNTSDASAVTTAPESSSVSSSKASAISLHSKQPQENTPFQVTNMFPGDNETKYFRIKVSYKGDIIVRYRADIRPGYEKLAEVLKVRIRLLGEDKLLYDGLMRDMPESLNHPLYTREKTQSELYYEITAYLDTSVGNDYQDKELIADFRWWVQETENLDSPQTGDNSNIYLWAALAAGSLLILILLTVKRRKEEAADEY